MNKQAKYNLHVPNIDKLRDHSRVYNYNEALSSHFIADPMKEKNLEDSWSAFKNGINEVYMNVLGPRGKKCRENHFSNETKKFLKERGKVKSKDSTSDVNWSEYPRLNKLVKKQCKVDDNKWADRVAGEMYSAASHGLSGKFGRKLRFFQKEEPTTVKQLKICQVNL